MGYCIEQTDSNFVIKKENFEKALNSLKTVFVPEKMTCCDYVCGEEIPHFRWVTTDVVLNAKTLEEALVEIRYYPIFDNDGNIINVEFIGEKYGDEKIFFMALAPFVESGSYISFIGEDGDSWEWFFDGKVVIYKN